MLLEAIIIGIGVVVFNISYSIYKSYKTLMWNQIKVEKIASNLEAVLSKKYAMIPQLESIVSKYSTHENSTFADVSRLRSQWGESKTIDEKLNVAGKLEGKFAAFVSINERYPNLKSDKSYQNIMKSIYYTEKEVLNERKYYNEVVTRYNVSVKVPPSSIAARIFGFKEKEFFSDKKYE